VVHQICGSFPTLKKKETVHKKKEKKGNGAQKKGKKGNGAQKKLHFFPYTS